MIDLFNAACDAVGPELVGLVIGTAVAIPLAYLIFFHRWDGAV